MSELKNDELRPMLAYNVVLWCVMAAGCSLLLKQLHHAAFTYVPTDGMEPLPCQFRIFVVSALAASVGTLLIDVALRALL
jgi:hypothetical protein